MELVGYKRPDKEYWYGRVDDLEEYDSFRWHQIIKLVNLDEIVQFSNDSYVIISYKVDEGIVRNKGRKGARKAPDFIKLSLSNRPCSFDENISIYDGGSVVCVGENVENAQQTLATLVDIVIKAGAFPIVIGGGHDVAYGSMKGVAKSFDKTKTLGLVNFDAHFDNRPYTRSTSGTMFRQIKDDFSIDNQLYNHLTIGAQKSSNTASLFKDIHNDGGKYILARDIKITNQYHNQEVIKEFIRKSDKIYLTVCCDVFSSAYAPGVSSPQPLGMSPEDFMEFFKTFIDSDKLICMDIAEASPDLDNSNTTMTLVSLIIYTLINYKYETK